jgi:hypothetical protein
MISLFAANWREKFNPIRARSVRETCAACGCQAPPVEIFAADKMISAGFY